MTDETQLAEACAKFIATVPASKKGRMLRLRPQVGFGDTGAGLVTVIVIADSEEDAARTEQILTKGLHAAEKDYGLVDHFMRNESAPTPPRRVAPMPVRSAAEIAWYALPTAWESRLVTHPMGSALSNAIISALNTGKPEIHQGRNAFCVFAMQSPGVLEVVQGIAEYDAESELWVWTLSTGEVHSRRRENDDRWFCTITLREASPEAYDLLFADMTEGALLRAEPMPSSMEEWVEYPIERVAPLEFVEIQLPLPAKSNTWTPDVLAKEDGHAE